MSMWNLDDWEQISCGEYEELFAKLGPDAVVHSSYTDIHGEYGDPIIYTEWGLKQDNHGTLRGYRYPSETDGVMGEDRKPCEHYKRVRTPKPEGS